MRVKQLVAILIPALLLVACEQFDATDIWDKINEIDNRLTSLESQVSEMNSDISTLQALVEAMQKNDMVEKIETLPNGAGYKIIFRSGKEITLYNGTNGQDAQAPKVSVKQDTDGEWYWTIDGEWLIVDGHKVKAVGKDGKNGTDGVTPQLQIIEGYWYLFNGTEWVQLGKATGADGKDANSLIKSIEIENGYVIITLNDNNNTVITLKMAKEGDDNHEDSEVLPIQDYLVRETCLTYFDMDNDSRFTYGEARKVKNIRDYFKGKEISTFDELKYFTSLSEIGGRAFQDCKRLESIVLPESITRIGEYAFSGCSALKIVNIPQAVRTIGNYAFSHCGSKSELVIPEGVTTIGEGVFAGCSAPSFSLPSSLTGEIGKSAFESCRATSIDLSQTSVTAIGKNAFLNSYNIKTVLLPQQIQSIGDFAFRGVNNVECYLPDSITHIGCYAFYDGISNFRVPASIVHIGSYSFNRTKIDTVVLPSSLQSIGHHAIEKASTVYFSTEYPPELYRMNSSHTEEGPVGNSIVYDDRPFSSYTHVYVPSGSVGYYYNTWKVCYNKDFYEHFHEY